MASSVGLTSFSDIYAIGPSFDSASLSSAEVNFQFPHCCLFANCTPVRPISKRLGPFSRGALVVRWSFTYSAIYFLLEKYGLQEIGVKGVWQKCNRPCLRPRYLYEDTFTAAWDLNICYSLLKIAIDQGRCPGVQFVITARPEASLLMCRFANRRWRHIVTLLLHFLFLQSCVWSCGHYRRCSCLWRSRQRQLHPR